MPYAEKPEKGLIWAPGRLGEEMSAARRAETAPSRSTCGEACEALAGAQTRIVVGRRLSGMYLWAVDQH